MIVEDQALIGMSLEASLAEMGFRIEGPFMSKAQALRWLESDTPDIALLDFMIKDGTSVEIARALRSRSIPFAIYSGLSAKIDRPPELRDVPWLEKPASRETIAATLVEIAIGNAAK
jgi:DNA-binding response OmpR family regulator